MLQPVLTTGLLRLFPLPQPVRLCVAGRIRLIKGICQVIWSGYIALAGKVAAFVSVHPRCTA